MILDLDVGNTRIKWRLDEDADTDCQGRVAASVEQLMSEAVADRAVTRVRVSCVRKGELLTELATRLHRERGLSLEVAQVTRKCHGVQVAYADLARLGIDRWLAMLAAYRDAHAPVIVVDCGTALTVDLLAGDGMHIGGYIVPGLTLGARALTDNTAIRLDAAPQWQLAPGNSTEEAVYHGLLAMVTGLLEKVAIHNRAQLFGTDTPGLYLTGGDAALVERFTALPGLTVHHVPDLVLDGLAVALP